MNSGQENRRGHQAAAENQCQMGIIRYMPGKIKIRPDRETKAIDCVNFVFPACLVLQENNRSANCADQSVDQSGKGKVIQ